MGSSGGIRLLLPRHAKAPTWLRRALRRAGIPIQHDRIGGKSVRCIVLRGADARVVHGGTIEIRLPGEVVYRNGLYPDSVLAVRDLHGRTLIANLLLCRNCVFTSGVRIPGSTQIHCQICGRIWEEGAQGW
ncbi:MAG: hypothetical protein HY340_00595 [Candidatus Kerfeldbacteria bacterium]|nr:hypothetical protein [Candidatus Kerfeldbacteria bacterium]